MRLKMGIMATKKKGNYDTPIHNYDKIFKMKCLFLILTTFLVKIITY